MKLIYDKDLWAASLAWLAFALTAAGAPIVMLMDTTAPGGVYDTDNRATGGNNTKELRTALGHKDFLPLSSLHAEPITPDWAGEARVLTLRPDLVIIHRSSFYHPVNAVLNLGKPPFSDPAEEAKFRRVYNLADDRLISLLGNVASEVPRTRFLVYSRGTDTNWLDTSFRADWVRRIETRIPKLKDRITTMVVRGGDGGGTFRDPTTAEELRQHVKTILNLPDKS